MFAPPKSNVPDREAEQLLSELSTDLMSPYCPGRTIASCPSKAARKLEERILEDAKSGKSREEIEQALVADFGNDIIGYRPPAALMITTVVGGILGLSLLIVMGRRWVRKARAAESVVQRVAAPREQGGDAGPSVAELDALEDALDDEEGF